METLQRIYATAYKHLAGQHNQKRHGYRYGGLSIERARQLKREGNLNDYLNYARGTNVTDKQLNAAQAKIRAARDRYASAKSGYEKAKTESEEKYSDWQKLIDERTERQNVYHKTERRVEKLEDKLYELQSKIRKANDRYVDEYSFTPKPSSKAELDALIVSREKLVKQIAAAKGKADIAHAEWISTMGMEKTEPAWKIYTTAKQKAENAKIEFDRAKDDYAALANSRDVDTAMRGLRQIAERKRLEVLAANQKEYPGTQSEKILAKMSAVDSILSVKTGTRVNAEYERSAKTASTLDATETLRNNIAKKRQAGVSDFERLTGKNPVYESATVGVKNLPGDETRAYHIAGNIYLDSYSYRATTVHELGHSLEYHDAVIGQLSLNFLSRRTVGGSVVKLSGATKNSAYAEHEVTKIDRFIEPYMGKQYSHNSTEISSMGLQMFSEDPFSLAKGDADYFAYVYSVVRLGLDTSEL